MNTFEKKASKASQDESKAMEEGNHPNQDEKLNGRQEKCRKRPFVARKNVVFDPILVSDGIDTVKLSIEKTFRNTYKFKIFLNAHELIPMGFPSIATTQRFWEQIEGTLNKKSGEKHDDN